MSSASPPAAPVMSQGMSAQAHGDQSSRGPSETSHEHHQHGRSAVRDTPSQRSGSLCSHVSQDKSSTRALLPLVSHSFMTVFVISWANIDSHPTD